MLDQLELDQTTFGLKNKTVDYYESGDSLNGTKVSLDDLDTKAINRLGKDQLVSSPSDMAQLFNYLFNSDYVTPATLDKVFKDAKGGHAAGLAVDGDSLSLAQSIAGGRNRVEWNLKDQTGTFLFSNYVNGEDNLATISTNMFDYLR